jgi:peptide-methionine (S)-S-oxide reductase
MTPAVATRLDSVDMRDLLLWVKRRAGYPVGHDAHDRRGTAGASGSESDRVSARANAGAPSSQARRIEIDSAGRYGNSARAAESCSAWIGRALCVRDELEKASVRVAEVDAATRPASAGTLHRAELNQVELLHRMPPSSPMGPVRFNASHSTEQRTAEEGEAMGDSAETAILAGGCFWGVQDLLRRRDGVISTRVGYTGGENDHPTYRNHPGHAEAVEIVFDPERISYRDILEFFFQIHDPTTKDRQGNDVGSSYRSEIFYTSDEQRQVAEDTIADVDASGLWPGKVVTELSEAVPFWEAEPEHQDYLLRYPNGYTCHFPRPGWKLPHRETAA